MRRSLFGPLVLLLLLTASHGPGRADEATAWAALRAGGHVALMRHAAAPGGAGDPPGFRLDDCATQRNLSPQGRADSAAIGARLREAGISFDRIASSPWCRCQDTARLLALGPVEIAPAFGNVFVLAEQRETILADARDFLAEWGSQGGGRGALLVVSHGATISGLTGISPASGEIVVVRIGVGGGLELVGRIPPARG